MDILTHAALGAAAAASIAPSRHMRHAALMGALAGVLPDADILIESSSDPLVNLEFHRHFTHALAFVPVGAALAAGLVWLALRRRLPYGRLYVYALVGYFLAPMLDACTSYGTHLLWPFSERTLAWNIISVFDPLLSLLVLVPLAIAVAKTRPAFARISLLLAAAVLSLGWVQHERAERIAHELAAARGDQAQRLLVKPTLGNLVLWRSLYLDRGEIQADAVRVGLFGGERIYAGERARRLDPARDLGLPPGSRTLQDIERFTVFADALVVRHPRRPNFIGDARYAMLPTSIEPLWGIVIDPAAPGAAVQFETGRRLTPEVRERFVAMLLGR
ncbi:MAG: metal-dependent hydrolase [Burkholderiales bacterium]|nr:metal-dependent hydrolase [Burkholderiales bacterium]